MILVQNVSEWTGFVACFVKMPAHFSAFLFILDSLTLTKLNVNDEFKYEAIYNIYKILHKQRENSAMVRPYGDNLWFLF